MGKRRNDLEFSAVCADEMPAEELATALEYIAEQIREGFTSGNANVMNFWWSVSGVKED